MTEQCYRLANIRDLLTSGFDDLELRRLCMDVPDFRPVYDRLARSTGKAQIVDELIEHSEKTRQIDTVLALAKERNPARYDLSGPYYTKDPTPALQKQVSNLALRLAAITSSASLTREQQYRIAQHWRELGGKDSLSNFDLQRCSLRGADLCRANLYGANLRGADLTGANLYGANLRGASLSCAQLHEANLSNTNLHLANLEEANLCKADVIEADLRRANLYRANMRGANLYRADLSAVDLYGADLTGVNLRETNLRGANLYGIDLSVVDLYGADLTGANLREATLTAKQLAQIGTLEDTIMPGGTEYTPEEPAPAEAQVAESQPT
jgi:uncharacterized protein YjbI with pentapeptide repeats